MSSPALDITALIQRLQDKYQQNGQDLAGYLEGLLHSNYVNYWDYIHLDTLLSLQHPKTSFPDEEIFIMYHQITELYFKLSLHELKQITAQDISIEFLTQRVNRINAYFEALTHSFEIMVKGMEQEQFLQFRLSLMPASGFQSAQYRMIEIYSTEFIHLVSKDHRHIFRGTEDEIHEMFKHIYWKSGATEIATGNKTLTLRQFEQKYEHNLIALAHELYHNNLWNKFKALNGQQHASAVLALKQLDVHVNINWPLVHYKSAVRYLDRRPEEIAATGGTNWQKYLPPRFQKRIFYPELWTAEEQEEWGKSWVAQLVKL